MKANLKVVGIAVFVFTSASENRRRTKKLELKHLPFSPGLEKAMRSTMPRLKATKKERKVKRKKNTRSTGTEQQASIIDKTKHTSNCMRQVAKRFGLHRNASPSQVAVVLAGPATATEQPMWGADLDESRPRRYLDLQRGVLSGDPYR